MSFESLIEWCHHTFNLWWGCTRVSPGCESCYAETLDHRWHKTNPSWGPKALRRPMSERYWAQPIKWNRLAQNRGVRERVFCMSMGDLFEDLPGGHPSARMQFEARLKLWPLIYATPNLDWLILTKRIENARRFLPWGHPEHWDAPWPNVWLGVTGENQEWFDKRVPILVDTPAICRFVSYEPALGPLTLDPDLVLGEIEWLIAGAESGRKGRPADEDWFRSARDQCSELEIAFFYKQAIEGRKKISLPLLDGVRHDAIPTPLDIA